MLENSHWASLMQPSPARSMATAKLEINQVLCNESVFRGQEKYKLKYKAAQARLFLRLLPFILCTLVTYDNPVYQLLTKLLAIVQILFSPVISLRTLNLLKLLIAEHLGNFKETHHTKATLHDPPSENDQTSWTISAPFMFWV